MEDQKVGYRGQKRERSGGAGVDVEDKSEREELEEWRSRVGEDQRVRGEEEMRTRGG